MKKAILAPWIVSLVLLAWSETLIAQVITNITTPLVTIIASDPNASESGLDPGGFTVRRLGPTNLSLLVFYRIGGTASNGVDYQEISSTISINAGTSNASIAITPIDDAEVEGSETVVLRIVPSPVANPLTDYRIGLQAEAVVMIADDEKPADTNRLPVINIEATDAFAAEIPVVPPGMGLPQRIDMATFKVSRSSTTDSELTVYYSLGGTAANGVDYVELPGSVTIPAGSASATIDVEPIDDFLVEGTETVVLALEPVACADVFPPPPGCYEVGPDRRATAYIRDNDVDTNPPPVVTILAGDPKASESGPDAGTFTVTRTGSTSQRLVVYYFTGGTARNGTDYQMLSNYVVIPEDAASADITVLPKDDASAEGEETVVVQLRPPLLPLPDDLVGWDPTAALRIVWPLPYLIGYPSNAVVIIEDNDVSGTNLPPEVRIARPLGGSIFRAHANITLVAEARDHDGFIHTVEFFEGTNSLGVVSNRPTALWPVNPFFLVWSNVPAGDYVLTAEAVDNLGASTLSASVRISVIETNPPPPPTNLPPVVTLVATDPLGSEGGFRFATTVTCRSNLMEGMTSAADAGFFLGTNFCWTNIFCGTNTASFRVRRSSGADSDLTVYYEIRGTAANGVDYVALPGSVTIPSGRYSAGITVVPIDDELAEEAETVVLALTLPPATSDPAVPPYRIGFPGKAAALILDNDAPPPPCFRLRDGLFHICVPGTNGFSFRLETSADLELWTACVTGITGEGNFHFVDPDAADFNRRFYRAVPEPMLIPED